MRRVGVLGGSFDPIHLGHLWMAVFSREQLHLDEVRLIPAGSPPHKIQGTVAPYAYRLELARLVAARFSWLCPSDLESDEARPSYTIETLRRIRRELGPDDELWLLVGGDSLADLAVWKEPEAILATSRLGVYGRPGHPVDPSVASGARWIRGPECGLSSTVIRERLASGESVEFMVPDSVLRRLHMPGPYGPGVRDG